MKITTLLGITALSLAVGAPTSLVADEHESKEETYIYATYFYCDAANEDKADELVKKNNAPIYDAAVEDGTIKGWGWLRHQPESELTLWYQKRFGQGSKRLRKIGIAALARKLLIALWRYVEWGVVPEGAVLKAA